MNNTQLVVRHNANAEVFIWLENNGYKNVQQLTVENYKFPVIVVDTATKTFFGTNAACMAAACSSGNRPIVFDFEQLKEKLNII